jgi:hypothetical protein
MSQIERRHRALRSRSLSLILFLFSHLAHVKTPYRLHGGLLLAHRDQSGHVDSSARIEDGAGQNPRLLLFLPFLATAAAQTGLTVPNTWTRRHASLETALAGAPQFGTIQPSVYESDPDPVDFTRAILRARKGAGGPEWLAQELEAPDAGRLNTSKTDSRRSRLDAPIRTRRFSSRQSTICAIQTGHRQNPVARDGSSSVVIRKKEGRGWPAVVRDVSHARDA